MNAKTDHPHLLVHAPIVVGVDGSPGSDLAVHWAAEIAAQRRRALLIVHGLNLVEMTAVTGSYQIMVPSVIESMNAAGKIIVADAQRLARQVAPEIEIITKTSEESPARVLIRLSRTAHMVVIGATGSSGTIAHLGSTLLAVAAHGHGAIVVVRDTGTEQRIRHDGPVVVGVDGSRVSEIAIEVSFAEASQRGTELVALHSRNYWNFGDFAGKPYVEISAEQIETSEHAILAERLAGWQEKYPDVQVTRKVYDDRAGKQLTEWSNTAQLIVVGSRGHGGFTGLLLGSTSNFLVQHAHCPVLVAHPE